MISVSENEIYDTILHNYATKFVNEWPQYVDAIIKICKDSKVKEVKDFLKKYKNIADTN